MSHTFRPLLHVTPQKGWINDPNGFSYAFGQYHLFAQYNPYATKWGPMHWLHFTSQDLVRFKEEGIALKPDQDYDHQFGCFSGSALVFNHQHFLYYTSAIEGQQQQCVALSNDGKTYTKWKDNPIIRSEDLPSGYLKADFRDPFVFVRDQYIYMLVSAKKVSGGSSLLMYQSTDGFNFTYVGVSYDISGQHHEMIECPAVLFEKDVAILLFSLQFKQSTQAYHYQNVHSTLYVSGQFDFNTGRFIPSSNEQELDYGFDYYAPQILTNGQRHYLIAWQNMWDRNHPSEREGYVGQMTLVREVKVNHDKISFKFVDQLKDYYRANLVIEDKEVAESLTIPHLIKGTYHLAFDLTLDGQGLVTLLDDQSVTIQFDSATRLVTFKRQGYMNTDKSMANERSILIEEGLHHVTCEMVVDQSSLEIFIGQGKYAFSMNFIPSSHHRLQFDTLKGEMTIRSLKYHDIDIKETDS
jgi:beta-fructofuranosidase